MTLKKLKAKLAGSGELHLMEIPVINAGENISVQLCVETDGTLLQEQSARHYFEFKCADGKRYVTPPIIPSDGQLVYELENSILSGCGNAQVQVVSIDGDRIFKSQTAEFPVLSSINANTQTHFAKDFLAEVQQLFDDLKDGRTALNQLIEQVSQQIADGDFKGDKGDKGEKGDPGFAVWGDGAVSQSNVIWEAVS